LGEIKNKIGTIVENLKQYSNGWGKQKTGYEQLGKIKNRIGTVGGNYR
jgi:hypothetical protein